MANQKAETKLGWTTIVVPNELDAYMTDNGQLEANAEIIASLMRDYNKQGPHTVYVPGCGTGQLFAAMNHRSPLKDTYLFTDIREEFLSKLERRLSRKVKFSAKVDDIENSKIVDKFDAVVISLVLEHVDWKVALSAVITTRPEMIFLIIQANEAVDANVVTKSRKLKPSIQQFTEVSTPVLLNPVELERYLGELGYAKSKTVEKRVPDNKMMQGFCYSRQA